MLAKLCRITARLEVQESWAIERELNNILRRNDKIKVRFYLETASGDMTKWLLSSEKDLSTIDKNLIESFFHGFFLKCIPGHAYPVWTLNWL